jgi:hypothetical protein
VDLVSQAIGLRRVGYPRLSDKESALRSIRR